MSTGTGDFGLTFQGPRFIANDERLALVPDNVNLDPGTQAYRVTVRFRTSNGADPNIIQTGGPGRPRILEAGAPPGLAAVPLP